MSDAIPIESQPQLPPLPSPEPPPALQETAPEEPAGPPDEPAGVVQPGRRDGFTVFFVFLEGCEHCAAAWPYVKAYGERHPEVRLVRLDLATVDWKAKRWTPRVTPTLIVLKPDGSVTYHEAPENETIALAWLSRHIPYGW